MWWVASPSSQKVGPASPLSCPGKKRLKKLLRCPRKKWQEKNVWADIRYSQNSLPQDSFTFLEVFNWSEKWKIQSEMEMVLHLRRSSKLNTLTTILVWGCTNSTSAATWRHNCILTLATKWERKPHTGFSKRNWVGDAVRRFTVSCSQNLAGEGSVTCQSESTGHNFSWSWLRKSSYCM